MYTIGFYLHLTLAAFLGTIMVMKLIKRIFKFRNIVKVIVIVATLLLVITSFLPFFYY